MSEKVIYTAHFSPSRMTLILDVILAFAQCIPKLDCLVTRTGDNLPVVSTEADGKDIGRVANEATGCETSVQIPQTESMVPGRGERELAVGGYYNVGDKVIVPMKNAFGVTVGVIIPCQCPNNDSFV